MVKIKKLQPGNKPLYPPRLKKGRATTLDEHVGYRLRVRRSLLGISQERLASSVGITFQQMQKYERGVNRISAGRLFEFSKLLDVPLTYFFEDFTIDGKRSPYTFVGGLSDTTQEGFEDSLPMDENIMRKRETFSLVRLYYSLPTPAMRRKLMVLLRNAVARALEDPDAPLPPRPKTRKKKVSKKAVSAENSGS